MSGIPVCSQRFLLQVHRRSLEPRPADLLQDQFDLGRTGRIAAFLGLAADPLHRIGDRSELAQAQLDDALCDSRPDDDVVVLHDIASVCCEPLQPDGHSAVTGIAAAVRTARRAGSESSAPGRVHGYPSADAVPRLRRICGAFRIRHGCHDDAAIGRYVDSHNAPLDDVAWMFLSIGIMLGGKWAYHELGWGGFWAWDPVENASLMPWLIGTAFLHSVMVQEKKGMLKVWNVVLVIMAYIMSIFGTFLTRSGVVNSVHAFAQSSIGGYFAAFIVVALSGALYLMFDRLPYLKSENQMESVVSRESSFMFNNLVLLAACFAVFWGTMFPVISEAVKGVKITVGPPFFNKVNVPIAIFLMFLTGVGPLLAWRKASTDSLKRNFLWPALISLAAGVVLFARGIHHFYAWLSLVMSIFVAITIVREFYKGAKARTGGTGETFPEAVINLTLRNTRRYGGYIVHFAFVLLFVGWSGQAFTTDGSSEMGVGDTLALREYTLRMEKLGIEDTPNYSSDKATVSLFAYGKKVANLFPERRVYKAGQEPQPTSEVAIYSTAKNDVYVVFAGATPGGKKAIIQVFYNPLTMWVWIGGIVLVIGTLIALLPNKKTPIRKRQQPESLEEPKKVETSVS